jgi:transposase-like protein
MSDRCHDSYRSRSGSKVDTLTRRSWWLSGYLSYKLSYRDLLAMMNERSIDLAHTTILRWVRHYSPEFEKRWKRYVRSVGGSWRMDETYVKVRGQWVYLYRAVDKAGKTVDFHLSRNRDVNAAQAFLRKATKRIEQDHRRIKQRLARCWA